MIPEFFARSQPQPDMERVGRVVEAYRGGGSVISVAMQIPCAEATVYRDLNTAIEEGLLAAEERRWSGPRVDRGRIFSVMASFPHATIEEVARLAECSEATVFRAKRGE